MPRRLAALSLAALLVSPAATARPEEAGVRQTLTLSQSVQRALQNNQSLLSAQDDIRIAEQRVREAQSQYYPQIGLNANGSRYLAEQDYVLPADFGSTLLRPSRQLRSDTFYSARVYLKKPLYNGGRTLNTVRLSETDLERARIQYEEIRNRVVYDATRAFYDVLWIRRRIALNEEAMRTVEALAAPVPADDGRRLSELRALQSRLRRALSEKRREEERASLEYLGALGLELYTNVDIEGEFKDFAFVEELPKLLARAQESRSEIRRTDFQREIDRLTVSLSQAERYPVVALGAAYELNDPEFPLDTTLWSATLNVSLPLFDGFSSRARIRQKRLQANQSRVQRTEVEDRVNLEVREAFADLMHWQAERKSRAEDLRQAETAAVGLRRSRDPVDQARATEWTLEAQEAYWEAVHAHQVALAKLEKAVGRPLGD